MQLDFVDVRAKVAACALLCGCHLIIVSHLDPIMLTLVTDAEFGLQFEV
jgi:hypothetical protein